MSRNMIACSYAVLVVSLVLGATGVIGDNSDYVRFGTLSGIAAAFWLVVAHIKRAHIVQDDALAAAHRAGYELALDHVARGLLDAPATPPNGHPNNLDDDLTTARVRRLHAVRTDHERRAG